MPGQARAGIALLVIGAIVVGIGTNINRGSLEFLGLVIGIIGLVVYTVSSFVARKRARDGR